MTFPLSPFLIYFRSVELLLYCAAGGAILFRKDGRIHENNSLRRDLQFGTCSSDRRGDREFAQGMMARQQATASKNAEYAKTHPPHDFVGLIPLPEPGKDSYTSEEGGLYPGWADGLHARKDGLAYTRENAGPDGTHPSIAGRDFLKKDPTSRPWFLKN